MAPKQIGTRRKVIDGKECEVRVFAPAEREPSEVEITAQAKKRKKSRWSRESEYRQIVNFARDIGSSVQ